MKLNKIFILLLIVALVLVVVRITIIPSCVKDEWLIRLPRRYYSYNNLHRLEDAKKTMVYGGFFRFDRYLVSKQTHHLLDVLLDSSNFENYRITTLKNYKTTFYFIYDDNELLGSIEFDGELEVFPSVAITKLIGGRLNQSASNKILEIIYKNAGIFGDF